MTSNDDSAALLERVQQAASSATPLRITAGNSKKHLGNAVPADESGEELSMLSHSGVISYEPTELVMTARAGTLLSELNQVLNDAGQMLPFEPPVLPGSTLGGVAACGLSGPRRPFSGAVRDYVLGTRIINGQGQDLSFGGQVMKNVAGYDVSRVQIGAWGTLGVLLDISMKVLPLPELEMTLVQAAEPHDTQAFSALMRAPLPLSGAMLIGNKRYLRLSGSASAVNAASRELGGEQLVQNEADIWSQVRDQQHDFFSKRAEGASLWRISVADHAPALELQGDWLYEWAGAQRWLITTLPASAIHEAAKAVGGHATRYSEGASDESAFQPLEGPMRRLQSRLRDSFDAQRIFNRGRFHPELDIREASGSTADNPVSSGSTSNNSTSHNTTKASA